MLEKVREKTLKKMSKQMHKKPHHKPDRKLNRNIGAIYGLAFFHSFMVIVPVIVPFFMSKGLSLAEIFYLQAVFATTIVLCEAPSGYLADLYGRRTTLLIGAVIHGAGYLLLNVADDLASLMLFEIAIGIAASLISGADLALLYDSQKALEENEGAEESSEHSQAIAQLGFFKSSAEALGALLGGALAMVSFDLMVSLQSVVAWLCLALALLIVEPPYRSETGMEQRIPMLDILRHLFVADPLLRQIVIAIPLYSLATFHVAWLMQPYWESQGLTLAVFGLLWFIQSLTVALANRYGFTLERRLGAVGALLLIGLLPVLGHLGMAWLSGWAGIAIGLTLFVCRGLNQVILVNALNRRVPSEFRATANSFTSFLFRLSFILSGPVVGYLAETQGLRSTLTLLGVSFAVMFFLVMWPLIQSVRNLRRRAAA